VIVEAKVAKKKKGGKFSRNSENRHHGYHLFGVFKHPQRGDEKGGREEVQKGV